MLNAPYFISTQSRTYIKAEGELKLWKKKDEKNNNSNKNIFGREMCKIHDGVWISWQKMLCWYKLYVKRSKTNHFYKYNICQAILPQVEAPFLERILLSYNCFNCFSFFFLLMHILEIENTWVPIRPWKIFYLLVLTSYKQSGAYFHLLLTGRNICWPNLSAANTKGILNKVSSERFRLQCLSRFIDLRHCQNIFTWANISNGALLVVLLSSVHKWLKGKLGTWLKNTNIL